MSRRASERKANDSPQTNRIPGFGLSAYNAARLGRFVQSFQQATAGLLNCAPQ
jgi:hypothetical protein